MFLRWAYFSPEGMPTRIDPTKIAKIVEWTRKADWNLDRLFLSIPKSKLDDILVLVDVILASASVDHKVIASAIGNIRYASCLPRLWFILVDSD
jgi:hypothetical protein